jgi:hypothetical protein
VLIQLHVITCCMPSTRAHSYNTQKTGEHCQKHVTPRPDLSRDASFAKPREPLSVLDSGRACACTCAVYIAATRLLIITVFTRPRGSLARVIDACRINDISGQSETRLGTYLSRSCQGPLRGVRRGAAGHARVSAAISRASIAGSSEFDHDPFIPSIRPF